MVYGGFSGLSAFFGVTLKDTVAGLLAVNSDWTLWLGSLAVTGGWHSG